VGLEQNKEKACWEEVAVEGGTVLDARHNNLGAVAGDHVEEVHMEGLLIQRFEHGLLHHGDLAAVPLCKPFIVLVELK